jgi:hypothetical protein
VGVAAAAGAAELRLVDATARHYGVAPIVLIDQLQKRKLLPWRTALVKDAYRHHRAAGLGMTGRTSHIAGAWVVRDRIGLDDHARTLR